MQTLQQKRIYNKRELKILDSKLYYKTSKFDGENELNIPFENLSNEKSTYTTKNPVLLLVSALLYVFALFAFIFRHDKDMEPDMWIVWLFLGTVFLIIFLFNRENSWKIRLFNNTYIFIYKNIPNQKATEEFIDNIFIARNQFLKENYMHLDKNLSYENQFNNLKWLKNIEAISKSEFDEKYNELQALYAPSKKTIGFEKG